MVTADKYTTLMTSLPHHGRLFAAKQTPLSRIRLETRLQMLDTEDRALLREIEKLLHWWNHSIGKSDAEIAALSRQLMSTLRDELLRDIVSWRLELRTLVAALRRRALGQNAPGGLRDWGFGRWLDQIQHYWSEPGFRLEGVFPWVLEADRFLNDRDTLGLERLLLGLVWNKLGRASEGHYFDFTAVVIYVLRWNIIARWTRNEGRKAVMRFQTLVNSGLGDHAELFV
ncbi:MAG: DUF2764 family protein [Pseudomonadota bacterium]